MDYKKIIAATAVTSAAFVVPTLAEAAATPTTQLFEVKEYQVGEEITAAQVISNGGTDEKIVSYDWAIEYTMSPTPYQVNKTKKIIIPQHANFEDGKLTLTVKTDAGNSYAQEVKVTTSNVFDFLTYNEDGISETAQGFANQAIQADLSKLNPKLQFESFVWYIIEKGQSQLLSDSKDKIIDTPLAAAGKTIRLVATTDEGISFIGNLKVKELTINDLTFDIKLNGNSIPEENPTIAPNDMLSVENLEIKAYENNEIEILNDQAIITYQWYYKGDNEIYSAIPDATGPIFLVPNNAFGRNLENVSVAVTVEIPSSGAKPKTDMKVAIKLDHSYAVTLNENIGAILDKTNLPLIQYSPTTFDDFKTQLNGFLADYNSLSANSKPLVTNYAVVQQALADIKTVEALIKELDEFTEQKNKFDADPSELAHAKLVKQFSAIEKKYQKFDSYKRSLLEMSEDYLDNYVENMSQHLKNITGYADGQTNSDAITAEVVRNINDAIAALFDFNEEGARIYTFENLEDQTRAGMLVEVERLEAEAKKIDSKQQAVINLSLLKAAKKDIKTVNSMAEKLADIDKATGTKKIRAILNARAAYDKLSFMQQSLITTEEYEKFDDSAYSQGDAITELIAAIRELKTDNNYNLEGYSNELIQDKPFANAIDVLLAHYKGLKSNMKKTVTNFNDLNQAKKDLSAATKVVNSINKAIDAHITASSLTGDTQQKALKGVQSKYRSAYAAYIKLTLPQRSIVEQYESFSFDNSFTDFIADLEDLTDIVSTPTNTNPDKEIQHDTGTIDSLISDLNNLEQTVSNGSSSPTDILTSIKELEVRYKALSPSEKKGVYNYSILSRAKSLTNKANSVQKTLTTAYFSDTISKLESAITSYQKLTYGQQQMIVSSYQDVVQKLQDLKPDLSEIESALADLKGQLSLENILAVEGLITTLPKKELQKLADYKAYQDAVKVQKAVDSFLKKYTKLGVNPTYSKKQKMIQDFKKLTNQQLVYLVNSYPNDAMDDNVFETLTLWEEDLIQHADRINNAIGQLITVYGKSYSYSITSATGDNMLANLEADVADLKLQYKALDSKERKLVTHYSFLSNIEKDIKAVRKVIELKNSSSESSFQQAYNRLTTQQLYLYELAAE